MLMYFSFYQKKKKKMANKGRINQRRNRHFKKKKEKGKE